MIKNDLAVKRDIKAAEKGYHAAKQGKTENDSPYPDWSLNHKYWLRGFYHGRKEK